LEVEEEEVTIKLEEEGRACETIEGGKLEEGSWKEEEEEG
jgi:hypothetical protein